MIYEYRESLCNDIDREQPKNSYEILSQSHFVHHKAHRDWPGREPGSPLWEGDD
jgi:hypothetical protein